MVADRDYRLSHVDRGRDYDESLATSEWAQYMSQRETEITLRLVNRLFPKTIPRYLDFACGTGRMTQTIEGVADDSFGVDISASMIEQAKQKCSRTQFSVGDITTDSCHIEPVNLVTSFRFFGNAQDELRTAALQAINRLLVMDGYFIFNNHKNASSARNLLRRSLRDSVSEDLTYRKLRCMISNAGFRILRAYGIGSWLLRSRWKQPKLLKSKTALVLENFSRLPMVGPFCPDVVFLAQKVATPSERDCR